MGENPSDIETCIGFLSFTDNDLVRGARSQLETLCHKAHLIDVLAEHPIGIVPHPDGSWYGTVWLGGGWHEFAQHSKSPTEVLEAWVRCVDAKEGEL